MAASTNVEVSDGDYTSSIATMYGSHSPWHAPEFPLIENTRYHTVLYQIPTGESSGPPAVLTEGQDMWDRQHVKMPTSNKSHVVIMATIIASPRNRWKYIEEALRKPIKDSHDLSKAILSYNTKFANTWKFSSMHKFFNQYWEPRESKEFFKNTLPSLARLALDLPSLIQTPIPMLRKEMNKSISMSQQQIACLLANAFFCTFPRRNTTGPDTEYAAYPRINFSNLYESDSDGIMEKLKCICHYFNRVCSVMPSGVVTFSRRHVKLASCPNWERSQVKVGSTPLYVDQHVNIEDAEGLIQVIFSNKFIGGDVLDSGLLQQEIRFLIYPELMASMLFTEALGPNDALMIIGCERFSRYTGHDRATFRWAGDFSDVTPVDNSGRKRCAVLAIDAQNFHGKAKQHQKDMILRELNKAYIGFSFFTDHSSPWLQYPGVATGNWGCGAFSGDPQLKALVQLMACAQARRPIAYLTFKDANLKNEVTKIFDTLKRHNATVGGLFNLIARYHNTDSRLDLHKYVTVQLEKTNTPPANTPVMFGVQQNTSRPHTFLTSNAYYRSSPPHNPVKPPTYSSWLKAGNRSSAPLQTEPRLDSPPAWSPSPSYSDFYVSPGGKLPSFYGLSKNGTVKTGPLAKEKYKETSNTAKAQQPSTAMEGPPSEAPEIPNAHGSQQIPADPPAYDSSSASARARKLAAQAQYARKIAEIEKAAAEAELRAAVAAIDAEENDRL